MEEELDELAATDVKKIRLAQRYHLIGNDCLIESNGVKPFLAKILDVSNAGALISTKKYSATVGEVVDVYLRMTINDENKIFYVKSVIKSVRAEQDFDTLMCGVEFIDISSELELLLKNYIYKSLTE